MSAGAEHPDIADPRDPAMRVCETCAEAAAKHGRRTAEFELAWLPSVNAGRQVHRGTVGRRLRDEGKAEPRLVRSLRRGLGEVA